MTRSHEVYAITPLGQGHLYMMPKPSAETLEADIRHYRDLGLTRIVSLLLPKEIIKLGLQRQKDFCKKYGLIFDHFPIQDMNVPDLRALKEFNQTLVKACNNGEHIAIHCHGGRGRAGTVAITLMQEFGFSPSQATEKAQLGRKDPNVPVCEVQRQFVQNYLACF